MARSGPGLDSASASLSSASPRYWRRTLGSGRRTLGSGRRTLGSGRRTPSSGRGSSSWRRNSTRTRVTPPSRPPAIRLRHEPSGRASLGRSASEGGSRGTRRINRPSGPQTAPWTTSPTDVGSATGSCGATTHRRNCIPCGFCRASWPHSFSTASISSPAIGAGS